MKCEQVISKISCSFSGAKRVLFASSALPEKKDSQSSNNHYPFYLILVFKLRQQYDHYCGYQ